MFFRKARCHSTKGLLTQRNAKKNNFRKFDNFFVTEQKPVCNSLFRPAGGPPLKIWFPGLPCGRGPNRFVARASTYSLQITLPYRARVRFSPAHPVSRGSLTKVLCFQHASSHGFRVAKGWCDQSFLPRAGRRIASQTAGWTA